MQIFKPKIRLNLLDEITKKKHGKSCRLNLSLATDFAANATQPRPIIIVPAMLSPGNLAITNVHQFLERGIYTDDEKANPPKIIQNA